MENTNIPKFGVSDFIALANQTLEYAYQSVAIEGEVSGFKVNQGKYVFFDLKDQEGSLSCFMTVWQLRQPVEDGMKIIVTATPTLTKWGKFSLTVKSFQLSGEGSLKRGFELLKAKLEAEGLLAEDRKRLLPEMPRHIGVISSTGAAGYADFIKIINDRWGDMRVDVAHVRVQGREAPDQIIRALRYFNSREETPEVIVIVRGGGSADDLSAFNDELLTREIAASRVPTIVGVGHETDTSLADLAADVRAATPSNAAQLVVPDRQAVISHTRHQVRSLLPKVLRLVDKQDELVRGNLQRAVQVIEGRYDEHKKTLTQRQQLLTELDPKRVLARGYAITRGVMEAGESVAIETNSIIATAEVKDVRKK